MSKDIKEIMKPYRDRIDAIDEQIIDLLRKRYDVIEEVGVFKTENSIDPVLQDRVDEVRERAASMAAAKGLDEEFIRSLYAQLIKHCCDLEADIMQDLLSKKAS